MTLTDKSQRAKEGTIADTPKPNKPRSHRTVPDRR
ncbi:hypothetical protein PENSTE_c005G02815 [Penicillium steckii]|uniref:Uncharacterized protein n=1 Tax=Penicillium steckii TaxID=303698 RepID=A0A1V6TKG0_9EURO|nr:hypothetical protein PENSTE_c005G02815 [Penicillium steckii]